MIIFDDKEPLCDANISICSSLLKRNNNSYKTIPIILSYTVIKQLSFHVSDSADVFITTDHVFI